MPPAVQPAGDVLRDVSNISEDDVAAVQQQPPAEENADPEKLKISYDFYVRVSNMLVLFLRSEQEAHQEDTEWNGIKCSALAEW